MIDTGPLIESAMKGLTFQNKSVPCAHGEYKGKAKTYLRYYLYSDSMDYFADDEAQGGNVFCTVDIFTDKSNYSALLQDVKDRLTMAGFTLGDIGPEIYETSTGLYHLPVNISIEQ